MFVARPDAPLDDAEWRAFVATQQFGHLVAAGRGRDLPVIVPTQFVLDARETQDVVLVHLAAPNPIWAALAENPWAVLALAGDWAYIPAAWKAIGSEDPSQGIPTTYYAAVHLRGTVAVLDDADDKLALLRSQLAVFEPGSGAADPSAHGPQLASIRGLELRVREVSAKFKYGGNVDAGHRLAVAEQLAQRQLPGDDAARRHLLRRHARVLSRRDETRGRS